MKRKHLTDEQEARLKLLLSEFDLPDLQCVVVEDDWPEHEIVWQMIEDRVTGRTLPTEARTGGEALLREAREEATNAMYDAANWRADLLIIHDMLRGEAGKQTAAGEAFKVADTALSHPTPADDARTPDDVVEALGEVKTNIAWAEEHYSGPEFFDVAWPEIRKSLDALNTALTASGDARERDKNAFNHGYLVAISTMLHQHDEPVMAEDALRDSGLQWQAVKALGLDEFDLKVLRPVFRDMERKDALLDTPPAGDGGGV
ncbi:MAG: hypothetical protein ABGX08_17285 [Citromicrobium sp.]